MPEVLKKLLGLEKKSEYEKKYFEHANTKASIYMSVIVVALELWMIMRVMKIAVNNSASMEWIVSHLVSYIILLAAGVVVLVHAVCYFKFGKRNRLIGQFLRFAFSVICIVFGIYISTKDYIKGEQVFTFLTMILFVACLYAWRPIVSVTLLTLSFGIFYLLIDNSLLGSALLPQQPASAATQINLFIMWISVLMVSLSMYFQRCEEAHKDESLENANRHLSELAVTDELTGIHNKQYFTSHSAEILKNGEADPHEWVFLFLDISNFKSYNEKNGFAAGNEFLIKTAKKLVQLYGKEYCARFSDDHFAVLADVHEYKEMLERFEDYIEHCDSEIKMGVKTGVYHPESRDCDTTVACDNARYACNSLQKGHKNICEYDEKMAADLQRKQYIVNNIDKAVENGWIKAYYQPVVWAENRYICGAEALARWDDPKYGFLSPGAFIPVLEEYHQIHKLDAAIVEIACRNIHANIDNGLPPIPVSVNFSRLDFELMDVVEVLETAVKKYDIDRHWIHVEITESALTENDSLLHDAVKKLKEAGYPLWLDDFGSGYSSLNVLKDFSFDVLKLDMQFLTNFSENAKSGIIIDCILKMAEQIGIRTLSEGVETKDEADFLRDAGCERLQGYLIGKPMPFAEFNKKLNDGTYTLADNYIGKR